MDIEALLMQSLQLLGLGMGAVFVILALMIVIITIVAKIVPEEVIAVSVTTTHGEDPAHLAAISAAIHLHRKKR
jgi:Na+-transporting methylmalonyl-CoA/oxaloacetate decarboxylase gamma subunit